MLKFIQYKDCNKIIFMWSQEARLYNQDINSILIFTNKLMSSIPLSYRYDSTSVLASSHDHHTSHQTNLAA